MKFNAEMSLEEGVSLYRQSAEAALKATQQKGFISPPAPCYVGPHGNQIQYMGEIPTDLTTLTDDQLGWYMGLLSEYNGYVQFQLAEADANVTAAKAEETFVEASLRLSYKKDDEDKKRSNPERDDCVQTDRRYVEVHARTVYYEAYWRIAKAIALRAEQNFNAISRRITQRGQDVERDRRNHGVTGSVNIPHSGPMFGGSTPRRT